MPIGVSESTGSVQIYLNSKYANIKPNNGDSGFCIFEFPNIVIPDGNAAYLSLQQAVIPYSFYSINENNNTVSITDSALDTYNFSITPGNYNISQLITAMIDELGGGWSITYNSITNKMTIINDTLDFTLNSTGTLNNAIGFSESANSQSVSKSLTSTHCINLNQVRALNMEIDMPTSTLNVAQPLNNNILATIPVVAQPFGMIYFSNPNNFRVNMYCEKMNMIKVKFIDNLGNLVNFNEVNWQATLQIDIENFRD